MAKFDILESDLLDTISEGKPLKIIKKQKFEEFNENILGLGNINNKSEQVNALSVLFDLEGFTSFCKQIDPQLAVPEYLNEFLSWLFSQIRKELIDKSFPEGYYTYSDLPFLAKYMGDGVLFLWNVEDISDTEILNIVASMYNICRNYEDEFYKSISKKVASPPAKLRCGIARGAIYSVGNGNDFVGPCINVSARLQKLNTMSFCFSRRGINPQINGGIDKIFTTLKTDIRGIGSDELVCVLKNEYNLLSSESKKLFKVV